MTTGGSGCGIYDWEDDFTQRNEFYSQNLADR